MLMSMVPPLHHVYTALNEYAEALGIAIAAERIGVSPDTMRRRIRGEQPWFWEEVFTLARAEARQSHRKAICHAIIDAVNPPPRDESHPLLLPSNLRNVLRLVGRITSEIAETLEDGRVDQEEARRLLDLFEEMDEVTDYLRRELKSLLHQSR